jgi:hypothetical protein
MSLGRRLRARRLGFEYPPRRSNTKMQINVDKSGVVSGPGVSKLRIAVDATTLDEAQSREAKDLAAEEAARRGFSGAGLCEIPFTGPVGPDGEYLEGAVVLTAAADVSCYRTEFTFSQRV